MKVQNRFFKAMSLSSVLFFIISVFLIQTSVMATGTGLIYGSVTDATDLPLRNATVSLTGPSNYSESTNTDEDGFYMFEELAKGDYELVAEKDGYVAETKEISLDDGEVYEVETIKMDEEQSGGISGYVYNIKGDPVENVKLTIKGLTTKYTEKTGTDRDGFFEFANLDADTYVITAKKKRYKTTKTTIELGDLENKEIEIELRTTTSRGGMYILLLENEK